MSRWFRTGSWVHWVIGAWMYGAALPTDGAAQGKPSGPPRLVLTFYYAWYGTPEHQGHWQHWEDVAAERQRIGSSTHYPVGGAYDSTDPALVDRHFAQMAQAGIDGVILSWWGPGSRDGDQALPLILDTAARHDLKVCIYLEGVPGRDPVQTATEHLVQVLKPHAKHSAWLKVEERPVVFIYVRAMEEMGPVARWAEVRSRVQQALGRAPFLIGDGVSLEAGEVLDGLHRYNPVDQLAGLPLEAIAQRSLALDQLDVLTARQAGRLACVTVIPGYDDTKIRRPGLKCARHEGRTYEASWLAAMRSEPDWVLLTSWNEWHEGSEIEPSIEQGTKALDQTARFTRMFHAGEKPPFPASILPTGERDRETLALRVPGSVGIWGSPPGGVALDCLVAQWPIRLVRQQELLKGRIVPGEVPVLVYVGGENVDLGEDEIQALEQALIEYGKAGGTLVWASPQPWPFYRNLRIGGARPSTRLGLELQGGYERPPEPGLCIRFLGPLQFLGEPAFSTSGDPRWRPVTKPSAPHRDFEPLAEVRTAGGRSLGVAAARWSRLSDAAGSPRVYYIAAPVWQAVDRVSLLRAVLEQAGAGPTESRAKP